VKITEQQATGFDMEYLTHSASKRQTDPISASESPAIVLGECAVIPEPRSKSGDGFHSGTVGVEPLERKLTPWPV
jgi:hypothetical protein